MTGHMDDFLMPLERPTKFFKEQPELVRCLQSAGLNERDMITMVHLVARALEKQKLIQPSQP